MNCLIDLDNLPEPPAHMKIRVSRRGLFRAAADLAEERGAIPQVVQAQDELQYAVDEGGQQAPAGAGEAEGAGLEAVLRAVVERSDDVGGAATSARGPLAVAFGTGEGYLPGGLSNGCGGEHQDDGCCRE